MGIMSRVMLCRRYVAVTRVDRRASSIKMMAVDEDNDTFRHNYKVGVLPQLARRVYMYFNHSNIPLQLSNKTQRHPDRLGTVVLCRI